MRPLLPVAVRLRLPGGFSPRALRAIALGTALVMALAAGAIEGQTRDLTPPPIAPGEGEGRATLDPASPEAGQAGTYVVRLEVGPSGILPGGGILVEFPKSWLAEARSLVLPAAKAIQSDRPDDLHWLGARASRPDVRLELATSHLGPEGETERLGRLTWIRVLEGTLHPGSTLEVVFGNTTAPAIAESGTLRIAVDERGGGSYRWLHEGAVYETLPGAAQSIRLLAPSQAVVGRPLELRLVALDRFDNVARQAVGLMGVSGLDEEPLAVEYGPLDAGILRFRWTPSAAGWAWPVAEGTLFDGRTPGLDPLPVRSAGGPIQVLGTEPASRLWWGDLTSHSPTSGDAIGHVGYAYARDAARLDFFAAGEEIPGVAGEHHEPGRFVTLLAYDCAPKDGHYTVVLPGVEGEPCPEGTLTDAEALWQRLGGLAAIAVADHLGVVPHTPASAGKSDDAPTRESSKRLGPRFDWRTSHEPRLRPLLEIYSGLGQSELFDPGDPLSAESLAGSAGRSIDGPYFARDAWAAGLEMGVVASSADHVGHPGRSHGGLTAVYAPALTREAIFEALSARRTYATTGERIVLDFAVSGARMGSSIEISGPADGTFTVAAPGPMRFVEVVAYDHRQRWWIVARWQRPGRLLSSGFVDSPELPTLYMLRVELEPSSGDRVARAWSSPVWVRPVVPEPTSESPR